MFSRKNRSGKRPCDNFIVTPHISPFTKEAIENAEKLSAQNIIDVLKGQFPPLIVNPDVLNKK
jgi:lactate dehydrogenase-like 2-hydroxyacid dehydrogenase